MKDIECNDRYKTRIVPKFGRIIIAEALKSAVIGNLSRGKKRL